jgi:hypothetical protein
MAGNSSKLPESLPIVGDGQRGLQARNPFSGFFPGKAITRERRRRRRMIVPAGVANHSEDGSYLIFSLDPKMAKGVDLTSLRAVPSEKLQPGERDLLGPDAPEFVVFGKTLEKQRKTRTKG